MFIWYMLEKFSINPLVILTWGQPKHLVITFAISFSNVKKSLFTLLLFIPCPVLLTDGNWCDADHRTDELVSIVVGAVLGGLVVTVILLYGLGRLISRSQRREYEALQWQWVSWCALPLVSTYIYQCMNSFLVLQNAQEPMLPLVSTSLWWFWFL